MDNSINSIAKHLKGTTREKIGYALVNEFISSNSLRVVYNMTKEDLDLAYEDFQKLIATLPECLKFVEFE